jgi:hypothetical protein
MISKSNLYFCGIHAKFPPSARSVVNQALGSRWNESNVDDWSWNYYYLKLTWHYLEICE